MKQATKALPHPHKYTRKSGVTVMVTDAHRKRLYLRGDWKPNYPVPALRSRTFEYWRNLGELSALNGFDIEIVQTLNRYR